MWVNMHTLTVILVYALKSVHFDYANLLRNVIMQDLADTATEQTGMASQHDPPHFLESHWDQPWRCARHPDPLWVCTVSSSGRQWSPWCCPSREHTVHSGPWRKPASSCGSRWPEPDGGARWRTGLTRLWTLAGSLQSPAPDAMKSHISTGKWFYTEWYPVIIRHINR